MPSYSELVIIVLVSLFVMKPKDIVYIKNIFKSVRDIFDNAKNVVFDAVEKLDDQDNTIDHKRIDQNKQIDHTCEINFYISKITSLGSTYEGEYDLHKIRKRYYEILKEQIEHNNKTNK